VDGGERAREVVDLSAEIPLDLWRRRGETVSAADPDPTVMRLTARIEELEAELDSLMADSWRAFVESGGDPDGNLQWHCSPVDAGTTLVNAVRELRSCYDDDKDLRAAEAEVKQLREKASDVVDEWEWPSKSVSETRFHDLIMSLRAALEDTP
jgi:hypothetical protein